MTDEIIRVVADPVGFTLLRDEALEAGDSVESIGRKSLWAGRQSERSFGLMTKGVSGLAGILGIGAVTFGIKDLVEAGMNLQQNQLMLQRALKGTRDAGVDAFNKINEAAIKSSESGGFSRDEELQSLTQLINAAKKLKGIGNPVQAALKANQAAINLTRADPGVSYASAQHYMAQALQGNVNRLKQYVGYIMPIKTAEQQINNTYKERVALLSSEKGLSTIEKARLRIQYQITKNQADQAAMNDKLATGQAVINRLLTEKGFKGAQGAYNSSTAGQISDLKNTFEEVSGAVGKDLLPVVNSAVHGLTSLMDFMLKIKPVMIGLAGVVSFLGVVAFGKMLHHGFDYMVRDIAKSVTKWTGYGQKIVGVIKGNADFVKSQEALESSMKEVGAQTAELAKLEEQLAQQTRIATEMFVINDKGQMETAKQYQINFGQAMHYTEALEAQKAAQAQLIATTKQKLTIQQAEIASQMENTGATEAGAAATEQLSIMQRIGAASGAAMAIGTDAAAGAVDFFSASVAMIPGMAIMMLLTLAMEHFSLVTKIAGEVVQDVWSWIKDHWKLLAEIFMGPIAPIVILISKLKIVKNIAHDVMHAVGGVVGGIGHFIGSIFNEGGVVHKTPKYLATGGPIGTDTVPAWLTPGEGILSRQAMNIVGQQGLQMLNMGRNPFGGGGQNIVIEPGVVNIQLDTKTIARAIVQYTLSKAARGPSSLSGGSLVTG